MTWPTYNTPRVPEAAIDAAPPVLNRGAGEAQVRSIRRLSDGRLVAIPSSPKSAFRTRRSPKSWPTAAARSAKWTRVCGDGAELTVI